MRGARIGIAMSDSELRGRIVAALNLTPLVPPQADTETLNVVNDAWIALSELMRYVEQWEYVMGNWHDCKEAHRNLLERYETLQSAAMRLCNVHRWSYGGPETLIALADRIGDSYPASEQRSPFPKPKMVEIGSEFDTRGGERE